MGAVLHLRVPSGHRIVVLDARTPLSRARGLLGRRALADHEGCLLRPCRAVHMLGMRFALDVVWLDAHWRVLRVDAAVPPGWHARRCRQAWAALELAAGAAQRLGLRVGDALAVEAQADGPR